MQPKTFVYANKTQQQQLIIAFFIFFVNLIMSYNSIFGPKK